MVKLRMITFSIIGLGNRGSVYADGLMKQKDVKITAVCDICPESLKKAKDVYCVPEGNLFLSDDTFFEKKRADILIENNKIAAVGRNLRCAADAVTDVTGCILFPGFIDAHTHFDLDVAGTTTADNFYTGSRAALRGGTTTIIDFACPNKGESLHHGLELWHQKADGKTFCDYSFHMTIDDWNESIRAELPDMFAQGISSFKMYMTYPAMMVGDRDLYWALKELKSLGGICGVHCENAGVIDGMIAERKAAGELGPDSHPLTRPPYLEAEAVSRLLRIAQDAQ